MHIYKVIFLFALILYQFIHSCASTQRPKPISFTFEKYPHNENEIKKYLQHNIAHSDPIEGIWTLNSFTIINNSYQQDNPNYARVAILRDTSSPNRDYIEVILYSDIPSMLGTIGAHFSKTAYQDIFTSKQFSVDGSFYLGNYVLENTGLLKHSINYISDGKQIHYEQYYLRVFPSIEKIHASRIHDDNKSATTASAFLVSESGLIITNYHVVDGTDKIEVTFPSKHIMKTASLKLKDEANDLAILQITDFQYSELTNDKIPFSFADISSVKTGQEVYTLGFPLGSIMGSKSRLSVGTINSMYGINDDPRLFQISNPLQPGNSGGPLFNMNGQLIGVVVSGLNAKYFYDNLGVIPQNVNFAVKVSYLENLLRMLPEGEEITIRESRLSTLSTEDQIAKLDPFVVQIHAY